MKKLMLLLTLMFSFAVNATNVSFTYFGNENGAQSYYSCDYASAKTNRYLKLFGATNINIKCYGGIRTFAIEPVSIVADFNFPVIAGGPVESLEIKGEDMNPACGLNVAIIKNLLKEFTNVEVVKKNDACPFVNSNFYYLLNVTR